MILNFLFTLRRKSQYLENLAISLVKREKRKNYANSKKLLTIIKEKGPLGKKSPFTSQKLTTSKQEFQHPI